MRTCWIGIWVGIWDLGFGAWDFALVSPQHHPHLVDSRCGLGERNQPVRPRDPIDLHAPDAAAHAIGILDGNAELRGVWCDRSRRSSSTCSECTGRCAARRGAASHPAAPRRRPGTSSRPSPCTRSSRRGRRDGPASRRRPRRRRARRGSARRSSGSVAWLIGLIIRNSASARSPLPSSACARIVHSAAWVYWPPFSRTPGT